MKKNLFEILFIGKSKIYVKKYANLKYRNDGTNFSTSILNRFSEAQKESYKEIFFILFSQSIFSESI